VVLETTRRSLLDAVDDLRWRELPHALLMRLLEEVERRLEAGNSTAAQPYLIPNDLSLCTKTSVLNFSPSDFEIDVPCGFSIQSAASKPTAFARPYYIDPMHGVRRCRGLFALASYENRFSWEYDLAFVGHKGFVTPEVEQGPDAVLAAPLNARHVFLQRFLKEYLQARDLVVHLHLNDEFFFSDSSISPEERDRLNRLHRYIPSIQDSRFVLCPRGRGPNSIRFFEALASANVPVFIGERETNLPLEWIIDWDRACIRIDTPCLADGSYAEQLDRTLAMPLDELNARRRYIFEVYHQLLAPERVHVFEQLVLMRAVDLLQDAKSSQELGLSTATDRPAVP
jgi:hypothetical protein